ncbi:MAG: DUF2442 domain-containing protein [Desulfamplus sp.]|nr:DUF2442 domain-containing protein [Desulfamplus sp.]
MTTLAVKIKTPKIYNLNINDETLTVEIDDGRTISLPLSWYPRLHYSSVAERENWRLIGNGSGIHWSDIDEDISLEGILAGNPSGESQKSLKRWLSQKNNITY